MISKASDLIYKGPCLAETTVFSEGFWCGPFNALVHLFEKGYIKVNGAATELNKISSRHLVFKCIFHKKKHLHLQSSLNEVNQASVAWSLYT